ncbi:50S ribosomal protein L4 [Candidatus Woesearchaeota archaeon]|nr:50S ribosomal protein L4 [Candidatus Woesearchaeota archaeon]
MELKILNKEAKETSKIKLPDQFKEQVRTDLVKRAVLVIQASNRQRYGASPEAGKRASAYVSKRRRAYKTTYGIGQSRTPRKVLSRSGTRMNWVGAFVPQTVGGRRAHPPKASKIWTQKINTTENRKAIRSALSATMIPELVKARGHIIPQTYPFAISDEYNTINKTSELKKSLKTLGLIEDIERATTKKVRAGKGKARGRKHRTKKSILFVVSQDSELTKSARNLPGCEVIKVKELNAEILAPGTVPGRLTLFTESALKKIKEDSLFMKTTKSTKEEKTETKKTITKKTTKKVTKKESGDKK